MPHRKHTQEELMIVIQTLVHHMDLYLRYQSDEAVVQALFEVLAQARSMFEPAEFKAERCDETPDFWIDDSGIVSTPQLSPLEPRFSPQTKE